MSFEFSGSGRTGRTPRWMLKKQLQVAKKSFAQINKIQTIESKVKLKNEIIAEQIIKTVAKSTDIVILEREKKSDGTVRISYLQQCIVWLRSIFIS